MSIYQYPSPTKGYTVKYTKIGSVYMGQLIEWPEVVTEGKDIEDCRVMIRDAIREMILAYQQQQKEIPLGGCLMKYANKQVFHQSFDHWI